MSKKLCDMSLEELWQLFPIFLTEHNECWNIWYTEELLFLERVLYGREIQRISHVGSTVIKGIWAKPIIDILVELEQETDMGQIRDLLTSGGYVCMSQSENRMSFNKGYTEDGFAGKVYHLHLRYTGDNDELYFRDYMNDTPEAAEEYETLKLGLWKQYEHDRDGYTERKTAFVKEYTQMAKKKYDGRYGR
jgi:GrpB-like predicted nucleotidyltransferase (UPF0157 family)